MRLMLGSDGVPSLLVTVGDFFNRDYFDFRVVNGAWDGVFTNGYITVYGPGKECISYIDHKLEILCDEQDRLRGHYEDVFANFSNPTWISPPDKTVDDFYDDDVAF